MFAVAGVVLLMLSLPGNALGDSTSSSASAPETESARHSIEILYFGDISCAHCDTFVSAEAPMLEDEYGVSLKIEAFDILRSARMDEARALLSEYGREFRIFPVLFIGNNAYQGNSEIAEQLPRELGYYAEHGEFRGTVVVGEADGGAQLAGAEAGEPGSAAGSNEAVPVYDRAGEAPVLLYFWAEGCPACARAAPELDRLEARLPELDIQRYEISTDREALARFRELARERNIGAAGVPSFFLGEYSWVGIGPGTVPEIEQVARELLRERDMAGRPDDAERRSMSGGRAGAIELPVFGNIGVETLPAFVVTAAIAAVDGFNPCSLWVLTFLIGLIVRTGSRRRTLAVGLVFLLITASVYGLFMLGVFSVLAAAAELVFVRLVIAALAVGMGLINMKDYFAFKWGISLTIPEKFQPAIAQRGRAIFEQRGAILPMLGATAIFALGISVVELPCTAGFPVIWSQYVAGLGVGGGAFAALFTLYLSIYLLLEILVVVVAVVLMQRLSFGESQARVIKLIGGAVMVALGIAYFGFPEATQTFGGVGLIFALAIGLSVVALIASRLISLSSRH